MILHLAGTSDARELALLIQEAGYEVLASVVTESAAGSLVDVGLKVRTGRLTTQQMSELIAVQGIKVLVDASHPFAEEVSKNAMEAAKECAVPYIRFERQNIEFAENPLLHLVSDYKEAAEVAAQLKGVVMLTTGSKTLQVFTKRLLGQEGVTLIARMLPRVDNMEKCAELGVEQKHIIAMQGPFTKELNVALYQNYKTTVVVTKESGKVGAVDDKVEAALDLGIHVVLIRRPEIEYGVVYSEFTAVLEHLKANYSI